MSIQQRIVARLTEELDPIVLDVIDESDRHAGHAGARPGGGTHYRVRIVSAKFAGLSRVARHRIVYNRCRPNSPTACMRSLSTPRRRESHDRARRRRVVRSVRIHAVAGGGGSRGGPIRAARRASRRSHRRAISRRLRPSRSIMVFASILALTGFIGRRAGEATVLLAAAAFMIQRLATHWRISRARALGRTAIGSLAAEGALSASVDRAGVTLAGGGRSRRLDYADCEDAEDAGGLALFLAAPRRSDRPAGAHARRRRSRAADRAGEARDQRDAEPIERFFDQPTRSLVSGVLPVSPW